MKWVLIAIVGWNRTCLEIDGENCSSLNDIEGGEYFDGFEVARIGLAALFAFQRPVTENFNGNLAEVFRSSATHYLN